MGDLRGGVVSGFKLNEMYRTLCFYETLIMHKNVSNQYFHPEIYFKIFIKVAYGNMNLSVFP